MPSLKPALLIALGFGLLGDAAYAEDSGAAQEALAEFRGKKPRRRVIQNRFFLKKNRFEISPSFGYVPNNPMVRRITGAVGFGFHFTEELSVSGEFSYSPDLGEDDLKGLATVLIDRAHNADPDGDFQQPLDKITLAGSFQLNWAPIYGKLNLIGETVVNYDFYLGIGVGMYSLSRYAAVYDENASSEQIEQSDILLLESQGNAIKVGPTIAVGANLFLTQFLSLRLGGRLNLYVDRKPDYDITDDEVPGQQLVNRFVASVGVSIFVPKMKPRRFYF